MDDPHFDFAIPPGLHMSVGHLDALGHSSAFPHSARLSIDLASLEAYGLADKGGNGYPHANETANRLPEAPHLLPRLVLDPRRARAGSPRSTDEESVSVRTPTSSLIALEEMNAVANAKSKPPPAPAAAAAATLPLQQQQQQHTHGAHYETVPYIDFDPTAANLFDPTVLGYAKVEEPAYYPAMSDSHVHPTHPYPQPQPQLRSQYPPPNLAVYAPQQVYGVPYPVSPQGPVPVPQPAAVMPPQIGMPPQYAIAPYPPARPLPIPAHPPAHAPSQPQMVGQKRSRDESSTPSEPVSAVGVGHGNELKRRRTSEPATSPTTSHPPAPVQQPSSASLPSVPLNPPPVPQPLPASAFSRPFPTALDESVPPPPPHPLPPLPAGVSRQMGFVTALDDGELGPRFVDRARRSSAAGTQLSGSVIVAAPAALAPGASSARTASAPGVPHASIAPVATSSSIPPSLSGPGVVPVPGASDPEEDADAEGEVEYVDSDEDAETADDDDDEEYDDPKDEDYRE